MNIKGSYLLSYTQNGLTFGGKWSIKSLKGNGSILPSIPPMWILDRPSILIFLVLWFDENTRTHTGSGVIKGFERTCNHAHKRAKLLKGEWNLNLQSHKISGSSTDMGQCVGVCLFYLSQWSEENTNNRDKRLKTPLKPAYKRF